MEKVIYENIEKMEEREINIYYNKLVDMRSKKQEIMKILIKKGNIEIRDMEDVIKFFKKISIISSEYNLGCDEWRIFRKEDRIIINNCITKYHYRIHKKYIEDISKILTKNDIKYELQILKNNRFYKTLQINFIF